MIKFSEHYALSEAVNSHMTHLADKVFMGGVNGTREAINTLRAVRDTLQNKGGSTITTKIDGAPAVFLGVDPSDGKFFVSKKGIFNKNPVVYKTQADIDKDLSGELHDKFSILLKECAKLGVSGIVQGDLLFTPGDLSKQTIDGQTYITFQPNTIVYAVPAGSDLAKKITKAKIGIAFHTTYTGKDFTSLQANFGEKIVTKLKQVSTIWAIDAIYENETGKANFTPAESKHVSESLSNIGKLFNSASADIINHISNDEEAQKLVLIYVNSRIRAGKKRDSGIVMAGEFLKFVHDRYKTEIEKKKSDKGKESTETSRSRVIKYLLGVKTSDLGKVFDLAYALDDTKNVIVDVLNRASSLNHFLRTESGFKITAPEGFVAINSDGNAVKLVDRLEFAAAKFSKDVLKGWQK